MSWAINLALCNIIAKPTIIESIVEAQLLDEEFFAIMDKLKGGEPMEDRHIF